MGFNSVFKGLIRGNGKVVLDLTFLKMVTNPQQIGQVENYPTIAKSSVFMLATSKVRVLCLFA